MNDMKKLSDLNFLEAINFHKMKHHTFTLAILFLSIFTFSPAQMTLEGGTTFLFATPEEGKKILTTRDDFVERLSPFDRAARLKKDRDICEQEYLTFVEKNVLSWNDAEQRKITAVFASIRDSLCALSLPLPETIFFVKTTGDEEGGAAYTRGHAIVFPRHLLTSPVDRLQSLISHEIFHILSRTNPTLREELYAVIGFVKCEEVVFPQELKERRITNPDAPRNEHCIRLQVGDEKHWAIPILFSSTPTYDPQVGGEFFNYLIFQFLLVEMEEAGQTVKPIYENGRPVLVQPQQVTGFWEQVGRNTNYIIHPEEILADNFSLLVAKQKEVPNPDILTKINEILKNYRKGAVENDQGGD